jgi:Fe-S oxidoreductase
VSDATAFHRHALQKRGEIILWDDTFVRYHEPQIGIAAVKVLEALGFEVLLLKNRRCCGRPAFSQGNLDTAAKLGKDNVDLLSSLLNACPTRTSKPPILFLEPSCWSMFVEDYRELRIENAEKIVPRCFLFEKFVDDLLAGDPQALPFEKSTASSRQVSAKRAKHEDQRVNVAIHPHCHAKSILDPAFMKRLVERLPGHRATLLDTACCGMAGAFGALAEKYDLSIQVAQDLIDKIENQARGTEIIASGTSCRHQISDLTNARPKHMAELLAEALP